MKADLFHIPVLFLFLSLVVFLSTGIAAQDEPQFSSVEERRLYSNIQDELESIKEQKNNLVMKEKELKTLEASVDKKIAEVDSKLAELRALKKKIDNLLADKSAAEKKKIQDLSKIYDKMDPEKAAFAISGMEEQLATDLLANMKVKAAAKILDNLNKQKATSLSSKFSQIQIE